MILGIDIGTTTISLAVHKPGEANPVEVYNLINDSGVYPEKEMRWCQNPDRIFSRIEPLFADITNRHAILRVGITGQMHGILYVDAGGRAVSPLYTWQDTRGAQPCGEGTYLQALNRATGYSMVEGIAFGSVTHFFLTKNSLIPSGAVKFSTIGDYVAMRLTGSRTPSMHVSNAAGMGLYSLRERLFDIPAIGRAGMDAGFYPEIRRGYAAVGETPKGALVSVAIGDNQASFLGSVEDWDREILLNLGTGGQISCYSREIVDADGAETRPLIDDDFIAVYTSHCAGRAYAALERFYRQVLSMAGIEKESLYADMERAMEMSEPGGDPVIVDTAFCGSRKNPAQRCEITNLTLENFTPAEVARGFLRGICRELYPFYERMQPRRAFSRITGAGNAIRKNPALRKIVEQEFGLPLSMTATSEEAASGAARFASRMESGAGAM